MKIKGKILCLAICAVLAIGALGGCTRGGSHDGEEPINENATQLLVGNFNGGYGDGWLREVKSRFEKKYKDVSFEDGKTGVQVIIDSNERYAGSTVVQQISTWPQHVILAEAVDYHQLIGTKWKQNITDITDVITTPMNYDFVSGANDPEITETHTIESLMSESLKNYYKQNGTGKYFGIPYYEATIGFIYDMDLFDEYGFYYCADGYGDGAGFAQDKNGNWMGQSGANLGSMSSMTFEQAKQAGLKLSAGPDGEEGTYDDGMPATYDEFFALCERIEERGCEALTWPGDREIQRYLNDIAYNLWTDYMGKTQMEYNFTFDGVATDLVDMDSYDPQTGKFQTYSAKITNANGYLLNSQAGKYYAIDFIHRLINNTKCYDESVCFADGRSQYDAETLFINSAYKGDNLKSRAMLVDGSWWECEAGKIFEDMAKKYGDEWKAENRRFGMMALPKATKEKVGDRGAMTLHASTSVVLNPSAFKDKEGNEKTKVLNLAKQFVKFMHTHESLYQFNKVTASAKPFDYTLTDSEIASLTSTGKQNYETHKSVDFVFTHSQNPIIQSDDSYFSSAAYHVFQKADGEEVLSLAFHENPELDSWTYFESMVTYRGESWWNEKFGAYIN